MKRVFLALLDFTEILMIVLPAVVSVMALYFAFSTLGKVAEEIGVIANQKVILVRGNATVAVITQK